MEWGPLVSLKAAGLAKVVASNAIGALDLHYALAHRTLWRLCQSFHLQ
jgi:hypothetical protein